MSSFTPVALMACIGAGAVTIAVIYAPAACRQARLAALLVYLASTSWFFHFLGLGAFIASAFHAGVVLTFSFLALIHNLLTRGSGNLSMRWLGLYVLIALLSLLIPSPNYAGLGGAIGVLLLVGYLFFFSTVRKRDRLTVIRACVVAILASCVTVVAFALLFLEVRSGRLGHGSPLSPSIIGIYAGVGMTLSVIEAACARTSIRRHLSWLFAGVALVCLVLAFSKSSMAAVLVCTVLALTILRKKNSQSGAQHGRFRTRKAAFAAVLLVALTFGFMREPLEEKFRTYFSSAENAATFTGRTVLWTAAIPIIGNSPFIGHGYGATRDLLGSVPIWGTTKRIAQAHNAWLQSAIDIGLIGTLFLFFAVVGSLVRIAAHGLSRKGRYSKEAAQLTIVLLFLLLRSVTEATFAQEHSPEIAWMIVGVFGANTLLRIR